MHEASLMKDLMRKVLAVAEEEGGRVIRVSVWLGALSHMSPAHFRDHFEAAAKDSVAEGAALSIETSDDVGHERAQDVLLKNVELAI